MRWRAKAAVALAVMGGLARGPAAAEGETLGVQTARAVDRGVAHLRRTQNPDGSFRGQFTAHYPVGVTALALYALAKSKVSGDDPAVARAVATWLEEHADPVEGVWSYPVGPTRDHVRTDLSNTQFAVLGPWTAEAHGHRASRAPWEGLARRVVEHQTPYGAFLYSDALLVVEAAAGGPTPWHDEEAFLDEITLGAAAR